MVKYKYIPYLNIYLIFVPMS